MLWLTKSTALRKSTNTVRTGPTESKQDIQVCNTDIIVAYEWSICLCDYQTGCDHVLILGRTLALAVTVMIAGVIQKL